LRCRLASLAKLFFRALRLASRLAELLLCLAEFALELLQLAVQTPYLALDRFNPFDRRVLCGGGGRYHYDTECDQRAEGPELVV
jgi:hypothetical protein